MRRCKIKVELTSQLHGRRAQLRVGGVGEIEVGGNPSRVEVGGLIRRGIIVQLQRELGPSLPIMTQILSSKYTYQTLTQTDHLGLTKLQAIKTTWRLNQSSRLELFWRY